MARGPVSKRGSITRHTVRVRIQSVRERHHTPDCLEALLIWRHNHGSFRKEMRSFERQNDYYWGQHLRSKPDGVLAGALYAYVTEKTGVVDPDLREYVLEQLIASASIPKVMLGEALAELGAVGERLEPPAHKGAFKTLLELALNSDVETSAAAFEALARFRDRREEIEALTPPATKAKLAASYRAVLQSRKLARQPFLEDLFGVEFQPQPK